MKRRVIKFVAGSLQLAPDRIEAARMRGKAAAAPGRGPKRARSQAATLATRGSARKRR